MSSSALTATLLVLAGVSTCMSQTVDYCSPKLCSPGEVNTLCKYKNTTWGAACTSVDKRSSVITNKDKKNIVGYHNELRRKLAKGLETRGSEGPQPPASDMRQLVWDDEIALMAQTHAQQCEFEHDDCRSVDRFYVGQNIARGYENWKEAINGWYEEVQHMTKNLVKKYQEHPTGEVVGHYTQVVWAKTTRIGCGFTVSNASYTFDNGYTYYYKDPLYVCNYGPGGNYYNLPVYSEGTAGSKCPKGTKNKNGLCL